MHFSQKEYSNSSIGLHDVVATYNSICEYALLEPHCCASPKLCKHSTQSLTL